MKAVLLEYPPYGPWDLERAAVERTGGTLEVMEYEQFAVELPPATVLLNASAGPLPAETLERIDGCRCIVSYGTGVDFIDLDAATRRDIAVVNMPHANVEEVATHALSLLLACARNLGELDRAVRSGAFEWSRVKPIHRLRGRRLGLLAFGNIPRRLAELARPLALEIAAYDPYIAPDAMRRAGVTPMDADEILRWADIISVHLPSTTETRDFLDAPRIDSLRPGAVVVVTSRGDVYDLNALVRALRDRRIAAAGLDVFPEEPLPRNHPVTMLGNVFLTPHVAGYSEESIDDLHRTAAEVIEALAQGEEPPPGTINLSKSSSRGR